MSDMADQSGEELDENLPDEYPPDRPLAVDDEGVTGVEQLGGESFADRDERTEPEVWERRPAADDASGPVLEGDADVDAVDDEKDLVAPPVGSEDPGPLAPDDQFTGDETTRDTATEREPRPAEEAAVRLEGEAPGATG